MRARRLAGIVLLGLVATTLPVTAMVSTAAAEPSAYTKKTLTFDMVTGPNDNKHCKVVADLYKPAGVSKNKPAPAVSRSVRRRPTRPAGGTARPSTAGSRPASVAISAPARRRRPRRGARVTPAPTSRDRTGRATNRARTSRARTGSPGPARPRQATLLSRSLVRPAPAARRGGRRTPRCRRPAHHRHLADRPVDARGRSRDCPSWSPTRRRVVSADRGRSLTRRGLLSGGRTIRPG